jgi:hypothetical protein
MKEGRKKDKLIEALHTVIAEFEDNPLEPEDANEIFIEVMSNKIEQLTSE